MEQQYYGTGRRKAAVARVFLRPGSGRITVNGKDFQEYFRGILAAVQALEPLKVTGAIGRYDALVTLKVLLKNKQVDDVKLGIARALLKVNPEFRGQLKLGGYLTRDAREVERKKYGLHKARRAPQYSKR